MPKGVYERNLVPPEVRFWLKVEKTDTCWIWTAARNGPYGVFGISHARTILAHRYAYFLRHGAIPDGLTIDHLCRNTLCVNPDHMEAVTLRVNILRGDAPTIVAYRSGRCRRGHERTPENTYVTPTGKRQCITCRILVRSTDGYKAAAAARARAKRKGIRRSSS